MAQVIDFSHLSLYNSLAFNTHYMATAHKVTNKGFSEWQVDQALAFAKKSIDSRFCSGYAMKNPALVGIMMQMQMDLENKLDFLYLENEVERERPVHEEEQIKVLSEMNKVEMTHFILKSRFINRCFTASEAFETVRPLRTTISFFKSEASFRGTILRELQVLAKKNILEFIDNNGTYRFL